MRGHQQLSVEVRVEIPKGFFPSFYSKKFYSKVSLFQKGLCEHGERVIIPKFGIMTLRNKTSFQNTDTSGWKSSE